MKKILEELKNVKAFVDYETHVNVNNKDIRVISDICPDFYYRIDVLKNDKILISSIVNNELDERNSYLTQMHINVNEISKVLNEIFEEN